MHLIAANFRGDGAYCYHRPCDNIEVYLTDDNINFLGKTADSITKTLDSLSEPFQDNTSGRLLLIHYEFLFWGFYMCKTEFPIWGFYRYVIAGESLIS